jgi:hypothetical protein
VKGLDKPLYYQQKTRVGYFSKKKEKKKGIFQKFIDLWRFSKDEEYYNY